MYTTEGTNECLVQVPVNGALAKSNCSRIERIIVAQS